jgi:hypothetical protein
VQVHPHASTTHATCECTAHASQGQRPPDMSYNGPCSVGLQQGPTRRDCTPVALEGEVLAGVGLLHMVHCYTALYGPNQVPALVCSSTRRRRGSSSSSMGQQQACAESSQAANPRQAAGMGGGGCKTSMYITVIQAVPTGAIRRLHACCRSKLTRTTPASRPCCP